MSKLKRLSLDVKKRWEIYQQAKTCFGKSSIRTYEESGILQQKISLLLDYIYNKM